MKVVEFNKKGGTIQAQVTSGYAQQGSYALILWEANQNKVVNGFPKRGNFINTDDDVYDLPSPPSENDGRLVESIVTISIAPPIKNYDIDLEILQDGKRLGFETAAGESDGPSVTIDLFIELRAI